MSAPVEHLAHIVDRTGNADGTAEIVALVERGLKAANAAKQKERLGRQCIEWPHTVDGDGYGRVWFPEEAKPRLAHRLAYQRFHGVTLTSDQLVCHSCDNPRCVNPYHLWVGTHQDNIADKVAKGRQPRGETNGNSKLTWIQVREMRVLWEQGDVTLKQLAERYGVTMQNVSFIIRGETWHESTTQA